jgi:hypothetical protein
MADKLTFGGMTWDILEEKFGIREQDGGLFAACAPVEPTPALVEILRRARHFVLVNERARAHRLVDPVLAEIEMLYEGKIITIPEMYMEVKDVEGLSGNPDFVISAGTMTKTVPMIDAITDERGASACAEAALPTTAAARAQGEAYAFRGWVTMIAIVEAKKHDVDPGLPQCAAELYAAYLLDKGVPKRLYGCVTNGWDWKLLCFDGDEKRVVVDRNIYSIFELPPVAGRPPPRRGRVAGGPRRALIIDY